MSMAEENLNPLTAESRGLLKKLRGAMLELHGSIMRAERVAYERDHGRVSATELFRLLIEDKFFGWFRPLSELVAQIDQLLDSGPEATEREAEDLFRIARSLLNPAEQGEEFSTRYRDVLQEDPDIILNHAEVAQLLRVPEDNQ